MAPKNYSTPAAHLSRGKLKIFYLIFYPKMLDKLNFIMYNKGTKNEREEKKMMNELLMMFGMAGIMFIPMILMFVVCGANKKHQIGGAVTIIIIWIMFTFGTFYNFL